MKLAIVGAGVAGLACIRRALQYGIEYDAFEVTDQVGGQWVFYEDPYATHFGIPVSTSMYSLRTNLAVALMEFPDFKFETTDLPDYPTNTEVLNYLKQFAEKFDLLRNIKFSHFVENVQRKDSKWSLRIRNLREDHVYCDEYDAVAVCSGKYSVPKTPHIQGIENFRGQQVHSHYFRDKEKYRNKNVLVIGTGASGLDLSIACSQVAKKIFLSCRSDHFLKSNLTGNMELKPAISHVCSNGNVWFKDESTEYVDVILYCTGYKYDFPFLDSSCGIDVTNGLIVRPLYKLMFNIEYSTMCFIGLPQKTVVFRIWDLQAQLFIRVLANLVDLPSKGEMMDSLRAEEHENEIQKKSDSQYFYIGANLKKYYDDLSSIAKLNPLPLVLYSIYERNMAILREHYLDLRKYSYVVIDDENYTINVENKDEDNAKM